MKRWSWIDTLIVLCGAYLRSLRMTWPIMGDEACTFLWYARHPATYIMATYDTPNNHIFHSLLMHLSYKMFGPSEIALRLPVYLCGVAAIPLTWYLALRVSGDVRVARVAALMVAFSTHLINYSNSGRGYAVAGMFGLILGIIAIPEEG